MAQGRSRRRRKEKKAWKEGAEFAAPAITAPAITCSTKAKLESGKPLISKVKLEIRMSGHLKTSLGSMGASRRRPPYASDARLYKKAWVYTHT